MRYFAWATSVLLLWFTLGGQTAGAYSLLTHEQLIDLTWQGSIAPLLRRRYPGATPAAIEQARAYAYAGCVIQDIGYYPFGDAFFSDLTHYVRSGDFVVYLFREAKNVDELAFAIGALSHYIGDSIGHAEATNLAVPIEFPKLAAKYGPVVNFAEGEHAHVQTEFAFDINEIAHHRLAPASYLRHVGLKVPTEQLDRAFYDTYGLSQHFPRAKFRKVNVGGFRFAVRNFIPRIAYAVTLLHRTHMPADRDSPDFQRLAEKVAVVSGENDWDRYRQEPGIGTYSLAGLIYILPKVGPLKLVAIKGPNANTEEAYVRSVNRSTEALRAALNSVGKPHGRLANRDLDTGAPVSPGGYPLTDETYAKLLHRLAADRKHSVPPGLKTEILKYYADPAAPIRTRQNPAKWAQVEADLETLKTLPVSASPVITETD